jgi:Raf kinase inhibitor-like YbhB/YbcL family protein
MLRKVLIPIVLVFLCACGSSKHDEQPPSGSQSAPVFFLVSDDFAADDPMPPVFTCDGDNISPALKWSGAPSGTKSFALTLRDPDAPRGDFLHWAVSDIPAGTTANPRNAKFPPASREFPNDAGTIGYFGPCPPSGTHRYIFTLYSLDAEKFPGGPAAFQDFIDKHALGKAVLTGLYKRK